MLISAGWVMIVPITDVVKMALSVADISVEPIIGTPLILWYTLIAKIAFVNQENFKLLG